MSVAFLDLSIENQKGGYIKPNQIKLLKYPFLCVAPLLSLSGTLSPLGSYCPSLPLFLSTVISATGQAKVARSMDDSQGHALSVVGSLDGTNPDRNQSRRSVVLLRMSIPWVAEVLAAY